MSSPDMTTAQTRDAIKAHTPKPLAQTALAYGRTLLSTGSHRHTVVPRLIAGLPLVAIGMMHITGASPMLPILRGTPLPLPELTALVAPIVQVVAGLLLLTGALTRVGAVLAIGAMVGALVSHLTFTAYAATDAYAAFAWPDEPPILLAIVVLASAAYLLFRGAGRFSVDSSLVVSGKP